MKNKIAEKIRLLRHSKNLSQQNMADELDISIGAYSNIERGVTDITVTRLAQLSEIFEVEIVSFFSKSGPEIIKEPTLQYPYVEKVELEKFNQLLNAYRLELDRMNGELNALKGERGSVPAKKKKPVYKTKGK